MELSQGKLGDNYDLADHFLACAKLGRYLTVTSGDRFFITDDFQDKAIIPEAAAIAAIFSRDNLVAEAALIPLSANVSSFKGSEREKYERLFNLIEEQTLSEDVRYTAKSMIKSSFRPSGIRQIESELGEKISPARERYRLFLNVVKKLIDKNILADPFLDEFREFTKDVAGKLDFGIYSFCLDSLFKSIQVPLGVKKLLVTEIIVFPAVIRRELLSNVLSYPGQVQDLLDFVGMMIDQKLSPESVIEIDLLKDLKFNRFSMEAISELAVQSGLSLH
jgi:hypothetical protein